MSRIGLDVDGVLADFTGGFWDYAIEQHEECYPEPTTWRFYEQWEWTEDDFHRVHRDFVQDGGYRDLAVIGGDQTRTALRQLSAAGHTIVLITARGAGLTFAERGVIHRQTADWLADQGILHHELHLTDKKTNIPVDWMLDDNQDNWLEMNYAGVQSYIQDQPWNTGADAGDLRVSSVAEYVDHILEQEKTVITKTGISQDVEMPIIRSETRPEVKVVDEVRVTSDPWADERTDLLARFAHELAKASGDGSKKRQAGEKPPWYIDGSHEGAIFSHLTKWKRGEKVDPDSGAHPLVHLAWRALAIACQESGNTPDPMVKEAA